MSTRGQSVGTATSCPIRSRPLVLASMVLGLGSLGCSAVKPTQTGFLSNYSQLHDSGEFVHWGLGSHKFSIRQPTVAELQGVDSFYIEPITWLDTSDDWLGNDKTRRERVTSAFDASLRYRLGKIRPIVTTPGPNTARVHAAVTDVDSARTITNIIASIVFGPISNGGASVEAEVLSPSGTQIAAISGASQGGGLDIIGYYFRSGHGRQATRRLSRNLVNPVREAMTPKESVTR